MKPRIRRMTYRHANDRVDEVTVKCQAAVKTDDDCIVTVESAGCQDLPSSDENSLDHAYEVQKTTVSAQLRELGIRPVTLYRVRRAPGPAAGAGPEDPRLLNRSAWAATSGGHRLRALGFRPLPQTTRSSAEGDAGTRTQEHYPSQDRVPACRQSTAGAL